MIGNLKRGEGGRLLSEPVEKTSTHRRCNGCRQWIPLADFGDEKRGRRTCRTCRNDAYRAYYAKRSTEELDAKEDRQRRRKNRRNEEARQQRRKDAEFALKVFSKKGWGVCRIVEETGISVETYYRLHRGEGRYVYQATVDKLYDALRRNG